MSNDDLKFQITARDEGIVNATDLENKYYVATVYEIDGIVTIECRQKKNCKGYNLKTPAPDFVRISDIELEYINPHKIEETIKRLRVSSESAIALEKALTELLSNQSLP